MALYKIAEYNPNYRSAAFKGKDIKGVTVTAGKSNEKIGTIQDILVDETGRFKYMIIDTNGWMLGKKILLPADQCFINVNAQRVYATGLQRKEQVERLPEYYDEMMIDYDYEARVRSVYSTPSVEASALMYPAPYEQKPSLYQASEQDQQKLRLYEERLLASKSRRQTGEVTLGKRVETQIASASVPVEKERVVIERRTITDFGTAVAPGEVDFREGQVARMEVYEETAEIKKQAFIREEINLRKEVERDVVEATETVRREELEVEAEGQAVVEQVGQY